MQQLSHIYLMLNAADASVGALAAFASVFSSVLGIQQSVLTCMCHTHMSHSAEELLAGLVLADPTPDWLQPILSVHLQPQQPIAFVPKASVN